MLLDKLLWVPELGLKVQDNHMAILENVYEAAVLQLRLFYKGARDEIFLDMFEDEYRNEEVGWSCMRPGDSVCVCVCVCVFVCSQWRCECSSYCRRALCSCLQLTHLLQALSSLDVCRVARRRELGRYAYSSYAHLLVVKKLLR